MTVAWLVAFAVAWGELAASILVVPPGVITLPIQIFNLIHYGVDDQVAGISLVVLAAFFLLAAVVGMALAKASGITRTARECRDSSAARAMV